MKRLIFSLVITAALLYGNCVNAQTVYPDYVDGSLYVKIQDTSLLELSPYSYSNALLNAVFAQFGVDVANIEKPFPDMATSLQLSKVYRFHFTDSTHVDSLINQLQLIPSIQYAEKNPLILTSYIPNDVNINQWYLTSINAFGGWDFTHGSSSVVVAIVDNAVRITHTDLAPNIWINPGEVAGNLLDDDLDGYADDVNGYDVADNDNNPNPPAAAGNSSPFIHGTHTSGIASAATNNSNGIISVGFNTKIMAVKCTPNADNGDGLTNAYDGVYYAIRAHANIISMSWGGSSFLTGQTMMNTAHQNGITLVAAAGNSNSSTPQYPAAYLYVIAVGATDVGDVRAGFSNYGSYIDVMAPGTNIYSLLCGSDNAYGALSGTSMAAPMVAGLCALVKALHGGYNPAQIENTVKAGCENIDAQNPGFNGQLGTGRINVYNTLSPFGAGVNELAGADFVLVTYPNPSHGQFTINFVNEANQNVNYTVANVLGQIIYSSIVNETAGTINRTIELNDVASGLYSVTVKTSNGIVSKQVMIAK